MPSVLNYLSIKNELDYLQRKHGLDRKTLFETLEHIMDEEGYDFEHEHVDEAPQYVTCNNCGEEIEV